MQNDDKVFHALADGSRDDIGVHPDYAKQALHEAMELRKRYNVVRFYFNRPGYRYTILRNVSLVEAQVHCGNPDTSSSTCMSKAGKARTRKLGPWFDGYEEA